MKTAKIFQNGGSQAVRLPREYKLEGDEVFIKKEGDIVMLIPAGQKALDLVLEIADEFSPDFLEGNREQPSMQDRDDYF